MSNDPRESALQKLLKLHSDSTKFNDQDVVHQAASLFLFLSDGFIRQPSGETFYSIPYRSITTFVFENICDFKSDGFLSFTSTVSEKIQNLPDFNSNPYRDHLIECYSKLTLHISLAQVQKEHVEMVAQNANIAAEAAQAAAEKAKSMQEDMMVNYITILGVFASIIITVFGGISLTNATVKLLESENDLPMMVFVISFLMIGFISVLIILITWISSLRKTTEYRSAVKWWILSGFCLLSISSGIYLSHKIKVSNDCQIGYYTCIHLEALKAGPYDRNSDKNNSE